MSRGTGISVGAAAALTAVAYLTTLGWHRTTIHDWQGGLLVVILAIFAAVYGYRGRGWIATVTAPVVLTVMFVADASTQRDSQGLWPIGAALLAVGSPLGIGAVAWVSGRVRTAEYR
jgi:hypothetical protein